MAQEISAEVLQRLQDKIPYDFKQVKLLVQALTHTSYANEQQEKNNERLEFLGDAVLEITVSRALYIRYPEAQEGHLTRMRSTLVSETALAEVARSLDLGSCLLLGKGEDAQGGREKNSLLSDALEALIGALFLDGGLDIVQAFIEKIYAQSWPSPPETFRPRDYKSLLQEFTQRIWKERPCYQVCSSSGPEHAKSYKVEVRLPDGTKVYRCASSTRKAEQGAAAQALEQLLAVYPEE